MVINIPVNNNFYEEKALQTSNLNKKKLKKVFSHLHELKLGAEQLEHVKILDFKRNLFSKPDKERLILKLYSKENSNKETEYFIKTGLYAGVIFYEGCRFNITTGYGDTFLKRMLNFVNDVFLDINTINAKKDDSKNQFLFIIAYLFIQALEKSAILGLPQQYQRQQEKSHKVRGSIDFNKYLKNEIPFQGKLTTTFRERMLVQEIVDVLFLTLRELRSQFGVEIQSRLLGLNQFLKQQYSGRFANYETIQKAKKHQSLNNPMYNGFKKVLEYAEIILMNKELIEENGKKDLTTVGYLFDVAELFEIYLEKLLSKNFTNWYVKGQKEIHIYKKQFYSRTMRPDLVMEHKINGDVAVFDAKFKKMEMNNIDVDREDLHQIHSYSGYYKNKLIASGLIYPLLKEIDKNKAHSENIYGCIENKSRFIVDGIFVKGEQSMKELIESEKDFISRVKEIIETGHFDYAQ